MMIIRSSYNGDNNEDLKLFQHSCYYDSLRQWIDLAGRRLLHYRGLSEWEEITRQWKAFRAAGTFDHRRIQAHHDLVAQRYRLIQESPPYIMFLGKKGWPDFFYRETARLMEDPAMLMLFMTALACANTKSGYDAEESLLDKMENMYGMGRYWIPVVTESPGGEYEADKDH